MLYLVALAGSGLMATTNGNNVNNGSLRLRVTVRITVTLAIIVITIMVGKKNNNSNCIITKIVDILAIIIHDSNTGSHANHGNMKSKSNQHKTGNKK